jgi:replicative DNA helicase
VQQIKSRREALKLSETAFKVAQGFLPKDELTTLISKYGQDDHPGVLPIKRINLDLEEILDHVYKNRGLRWRLDCLNKSIGSLRPGDFGFIFARPESGKTTFLASEATQFAGQGHPGPILWFNNEEQGEKVGVRLIQAYFGITLDQLTARRGDYRQRFNTEIGDRLQLFDEALLAKADIEAVIKATQPSLVIYDQIDKIRGFSNDRDDLRLGAIYQWARELAKGGHAAIGVCQADGTAEGVRYLTMEHVANAKTSKQAEADFIIGIGKQNNQDQEYIRYLNISKNKLFGDEDSLPDLRHGRFEVLIEPQIARYRDIIRFD